MSDALAARIEAIREHINAAYAEAQAIAQAIAQAVDTLDPDTLGEDLEESAREVIDALADAGRALIGTDEPLASALHHARRLP